MLPMSDRYRTMSDSRSIDLRHNARHVKYFFRNTGLISFIYKHYYRQICVYEVYIPRVGYHVREWFPTPQYDYRLCDLERADWLGPVHMTSVLSMITAVVCMSRTIMCVRVNPEVVCMCIHN